MKTIAIVALLPPLLVDGAQGQAAMQMPMLTPTECSQISRVGPGTYKVRGRLRIAGTDFVDAEVSHDTVLDSGVNVGQYIEQSCFTKKSNEHPIEKKGVTD